MRDGNPRCGDTRMFNGFTYTCDLNPDHAGQKVMHSARRHPEDLPGDDERLGMSLQRFWSLSGDRPAKVAVVTPPRTADLLLLLTRGLTHVPDDALTLPVLTDALVRTAVDSQMRNRIAAVELLVRHDSWLRVFSAALQAVRAGEAEQVSPVLLGALSVAPPVWDEEQLWWDPSWLMLAAVADSPDRPWSTSQRSILALACSLAGKYPVDLAELLAPLDPTNADLVADAVCRAANGIYANTTARVPSVASVFLTERT